MKTIGRSLFLGMLVMAGIHVGISTALSQTFLTNGLVAYFPFNGNANDASGNGNDGAVNGATLTTDKFGNANSAYDFDGASSYIAIPQNPVLNSLTNLTLSAWISQRVMSDTSDIFNKQSAGYPDGWLFDAVINCTPNVRQLRVNGASPGPCDAVGVTQYSLMQWHHVVATISGTVANVYLDGNLDGSGNIGNIPLNTLDIWIGSGHPSDRSSFRSPFNGKMDDIRIYNRALSPSEVQQLYLAEAPAIVYIKKAVYVDSPNLRVGTNYQLQVSTDLNTWTNHGAVFTATNSTWRTTNYWDVDNWSQLFFRLHTAP